MRYFYWNRGAVTHITTSWHKCYARALCGTQPKNEKELEAMAEDEPTGKLCRRCKERLMSTLVGRKEDLRRVAKEVKRIEDLLSCGVSQFTKRTGVSSADREALRERALQIQEAAERLRKL